MTEGLELAHAQIKTSALKEKNSKNSTITYTVEITYM